MKYYIFGDNKRSEYLKRLYINDLCLDYKKADVIITPIPFTRDNIYLTDENILIDEVLNLENKIIFTSLTNNKFVFKSKVYDIMKIESLAILNAIATSEGAIYTAIKNSEINLCGENVLVMGYGRIGKVLSSMLKGIGSIVYVEARSKVDLATIDSLGYNKIELSNLYENIDKFKYIFNTIPVKLLDKNILDKVDKDCLVIDLASNPGGCDFEYAHKKNIKTVWALSLPAKVSPKISAVYIKNEIDNIINNNINNFNIGG
ncbi:MAG: dipicolinate synthase subunit DpsA [Clostridia bacterium]